VLTPPLPHEQNHPKGLAQPDVVAAEFALLAAKMAVNGSAARTAAAAHQAHGAIGTTREHHRLAVDGDVYTGAVHHAEEIASSAPLAVAAIRATVRTELLAAFGEALEHGLEQQIVLWRTRDCPEGVAAARDRRPPVFTGS
jgi:hypothetical protein